MLIIYFRHVDRDSTYHVELLAHVPVVDRLKMKTNLRKKLTNRCFSCVPLSRSRNIESCDNDNVANAMSPTIFQ